MSTQPKNLQQFIRQCGEVNFSMEVVTTEEDFIELDIFPTSTPENKFRAVIEANEIHSAILFQFKKIMMKHIKKPGKFNSKNLYAGTTARIKR